jgi:hypothetical protein
MELTREQWLDERAERYRAMIKDIEQQINMMEKGDFRLRERTIESPQERDITQEVIARERDAIVQLQRVIDYIESQRQR